MGCSIQFVRLNDFAADIDSLDLSANGYALDQDGYFPVAAPIGARSVHEVITLKLQGTSKDDLAAMTQEIDEKIKQVQWWIDAPGVERYQVWLRVQLENESLPRQAQILSITPPDKVRVFVPEEINNNFIGSYSLGIERTPFWEDPYPYPTTTDKTSINSIGGTAVLSETINGDVPARLARFNLETASTIYDQYWIGWRTSRFGTTANFVPVWSLHDGNGGSAGGTDTTSGADGSAYDGTKMTCTFGSNSTLIERTWIEVNDVAPSNPNDQRGNFTVLLRAKMSDTSVALVRMRAGWLDVGDATLNSPIYRGLQPISGTNWKLYELGTITMPPFKFYNSIVSLTNFAMAIDAARTSGSGSLDMDCLILIPTDEGWIKYTGNSTISSFTNLTLTTITPANFEHYGMMIINAFGLTTYDSASISQINWSLPANNEAPRLIAAAQGNSTSAKSTTFDISYTYIPRWRTLRGNIT